MRKKPSLSAALEAASKKTAPTPSPTTLPTLNPRPQNVKPSRTGKKAITGFFDPAVSRQLKQIALDQDATVQSLMREALNDLFEKHGAKPIA